MKKYLIGAIFGVFLSLSVSVYAEEVANLIGRAIEGQFPVKVNDTQLANQAIVIDGTSYLPVRAIGDALNMEVGFNADLGITLKSKPKSVSEVNTMVNTIPKIEVTTFDFKKYKQDTNNPELNKVNGDLQYSYTVLNVLQRGYNAAQEDLFKASDSDKAYYQDRVDKYNTSIPEQEAKISELETKKTQLESQTGTP